MQRIDQTTEAPRYRSHGDPTGGQRRPQRAEQPRSQRQRPQDNSQAQRRPHAGHATDPSAALKRRRTNVLFFLVVTAACTMFLAATTQSTAMLWAFGLSFLGLCGYVYILAQLRERDGVDWDNGWLEQH